MNWLDTLNEVINYIEDNLDKEIDTKKVELIAGCSYSIFQRMFSYIADVSISEYIRRRKLSKAAYELQTKNVKVISVAVKYGYDSLDAFTVAFKRQHGITPSDAKKKNVKINSYSRLTFRLKIMGGKSMKYEIKQRDSFDVIGIYGDVNKGLWDKVKEDRTLMELENYSQDGISLGLCFGYDEEDNNKYLVAVKKPEKYYGNDTFSRDYKVEIWIPIIKD